VVEQVVAFAFAGLGTPPAFLGIQHLESQFRVGLLYETGWGAVHKGAAIPAQFRKRV